MIEIETERLTLRLYRPGDAALMHRLIGDPRVFFWRAEPGTWAESEDRLARVLASYGDTGIGWWAAFPKGCAEDPDAFLGQACLQKLRGTELIELGYHFVPGAWEHGYATEAARALLDYGFCNLHLDRIVAVILPENKRSLRVMQRLGLPYIEDQMHDDFVHKFFALSHLEYLNRLDAVSQKPLS